MGTVSRGQLNVSRTSMLLGKLIENRVLNERGEHRFVRKHYEVKISSAEGHEVLRMYTDSDEEAGGTVYMLPVFRTVKDRRAEQDRAGISRKIKGLVLASTDQKKGEYRRIGCFCFHDFDAWHQDTLYRFDKALDVSGAADAESGCAEVLAEPEHPGERYMVTIV